MSARLCGLASLQTAVASVFCRSKQFYSMVQFNPRAAKLENSRTRSSNDPGKKPSVVWLLGFCVWIPRLACLWCDVYACGLWVRSSRGLLLRDKKFACAALSFQLTVVRGCSSVVWKVPSRPYSRPNEPCLCTLSLIVNNVVVECFDSSADSIQPIKIQR